MHAVHRASGAQDLQVPCAMQIHGKAAPLASVSALLILFTAGVAEVRPRAAPLPGIGDSIVMNEIRVTLLDGKRLSLDEYRAVSGNQSPDWAGGGFRFAFLTENRPGAPIGPAFGEISVVIGSRRYNAVTNATSRRAFAPYLEIRTLEDFFSTPYGRTVNAHGRKPRAASTANILDVLIRGGPVEDDSPIVVELEQGETHRPDVSGRLRQLTPTEMGATWMTFRFGLTLGR